MTYLASLEMTRTVLLFNGRLLCSCVDGCLSISINIQRRIPLETYYLKFGEQGNQDGVYWEFVELKRNITSQQALTANYEYIIHNVQLG